MVKIDVSSFSEPIGAGMTATVYGSKLYPNLILKKIKREECDQAAMETQAGQKIYDAYREYILCSRDDRIDSSIQVPQYLQFTRINNAIYGCDILQERIPLYEGRLWHVALSDAIIHKNREYGVRYGEAVSSENPSRGFFAGKDLLEQEMPIQDIVYSIGLLDGIILFGAGYVPVDVEYILSRGKIWAIDFGLLQPVNEDDILGTVQKYVDELDNSIYYVPVDEYQRYFIQGLQDAESCFESESNKELLDLIINGIEEL